MKESPIRVFDEDEVKLFDKFILTYRVFKTDSRPEMKSIAQRAMNGVATVIVNTMDGDKSLGHDLQIVKDRMDESILKP